MRTIHKFLLKAGENIIELGVMDTVLDVQIQDGQPHMWVLIHDTGAPRSTRKFKIYGTGHEIIEASHRLDYISTFQLRGQIWGNMVWHVFEIST